MRSAPIKLSSSINVGTSNAKLCQTPSRDRRISVTIAEKKARFYLVKPATGAYVNRKVNSNIIPFDFSIFAFYALRQFKYMYI